MEDSSERPFEVPWASKCATAATSVHTHIAQSGMLGTIEVLPMDIGHVPVPDNPLKVWGLVVDSVLCYNLAKSRSIGACPTLDISKPQRSFSQFPTSIFEAGDILSGTLPDSACC